MSSQTLSIPISSGTIAAKAYGDPSAPPILALHGWLDNAASFDFLGPLLKNCYCVCIDLPGHGLSDHRPKGAFFHLADYLVEIILLADSLGWDRFSLLGHSLGGAIASLLSGTLPERIICTAAIDALGPIPTEEHKMPLLLRKAIADYQRLPKKKTPYYETPEQAVQARLKATPMNRASVEALVARGLKQSNHGYRWRNDPRLMLAPIMALSEAQVEAFLKAISIPICLIRPIQGWPFHEHLYHTRRSCVPHLETYEIPGQHHVHMDDAQSVAALLNPFFEKHHV